MFAISNSLSKPEAIGFARTLDPKDQYFLSKSAKTRKLASLAKRERYVVLRDLHEKKFQWTGMLFLRKGGI